MSPGQTLFVILAALYLAECIVSIHRRGVLFVSPLPRWIFFGVWKNAKQRWSLRLPSWSINQSAYAQALAPFLPPDRSVIRASGWPFSISADGITAALTTRPGGLVPMTEEGVDPLTAVRFEDIHATTSKGLLLRIHYKEAKEEKGEKETQESLWQITCRTAAQASRWASRIETLRILQSDKREAQLKTWLQESCDATNIQARLDQVQAETKLLRPLSTVFWIVMFIGLPLLTKLRGLEAMFLLALAILLLGHISVLIEWVLTFRKLLPGERWHFWETFCKTLPCPPMAARATGNVTQFALAGFHPIAIAKQLLSEDDYQTLASHWLRDLQHPTGMRQFPPHVATIVSAQQKREEAVLKNLLNIHPTPWPKPEQNNASANTRCPRCGETYLLTEGDCADCFEVTLLPTESDR